MPFDFPNSPTNGQQVTGPNGAVYTWDGVKWTTSTAASPYVMKAGDTMTGALVLPANATTALQAVPKQQLDAAVGPLASTAYVQAAVAPALNDVGRNLVHNALFNVQQRGAGPWTGGGIYTADRWFESFTTDTVSFTVNSLNDAARGQIGDEAALFSLQNTFTGNSAAGANNYVEQRIEGVRRLAGKTVTVSFWGIAGTAGLKLGLNIFQVFGTGGTPSGASTALTTGAAFTLSTAWTRYSVVVPVPSANGMTFGTNAGTDYTIMRFFYSSGATGNQQAGNIGVQSGTINLWGMQLEIGNTMTPLEKIDPGEDLRRAQRFYQTIVASLRGYNGSAGPTTFTNTVSWPPMRAVPTVGAPTGGASANASSIAVSAVTPSGGNFGFVAAASSDAYSVSSVYPLSADL